MSGPDLSFVADATSSTHGDSAPTEFFAFMVVWGLLGVSGFLFFHFNRDAALKRRLWPVFVVTVGLLFGGFVYFLMGRQAPQVLFLMVPAILLISFLNLRTTRFCDACGRTLIRQPVFSRAKYCPHCGAARK